MKRNFWKVLQLPVVKGYWEKLKYASLLLEEILIVVFFSP